MERTIKCNKFDTDPQSCRFYVLETKDGHNTGKRWKAHVDGPVDFESVRAAFAAQGVDVSEEELRGAYGG